MARAEATAWAMPGATLSVAPQAMLMELERVS
jgi:hypothetical protein